MNGNSRLNMQVVLFIALPSYFTLIMYTIGPYKKNTPVTLCTDRSLNRRISKY